MKISICIPTYNRAHHLRNCLNSIALNLAVSDIDYEICISDNNSTDNTKSIVDQASESLPINYHRNSKNLGIPVNFLNVVSMADGDYVWLIGDDDLLVPHALKSLNKLITENSEIDFFYINSSHLTTEFVLEHPQPFDTKSLPKHMLPFSSRKDSFECCFMDLIDPDISFDFLGGMFLSVFRRKMWERNSSTLSQTALMDKRTFSHFDNTFPHIKIFSSAFSDSKAYFYAEPLSVTLSGAREWAPMYFFIRSIRLPEAIDEYRKNGLSYFSYMRGKNHALQYFIPDIVFMALHMKTSGFIYVKVFRNILANAIYPNLYLSVFYFIYRRVCRLFEKCGFPANAGVSN